jgi:hypothetical protein
LARVNLDYHVEAEGFLYSVPHALIRAQVDVRLTSRTVEVFHRGQRVAAHQRRFGGRRHGTDPDHMPRAHRRYAEWTPERVQRWARAIGPHTEGLIIAVLARAMPTFSEPVELAQRRACTFVWFRLNEKRSSRPHPEQGLRTCLGVRRLYRGLDPVRAEAVSARAVALGTLTSKSIASILAHNLDRAPPQPAGAPVIDHPNVRGSRYFH